MIKIERLWIAYEDTSGEVINPEYFSFKEKDILKYMEENPMPQDLEYTKEDLIYDLTKSSGFYCLPKNIGKKTKEYIENLLNALIGGSNA